MLFGLFGLEAALGHKRTFTGESAHVRFVPKADLTHPRMLD
jgi:hypothetical protein